MVIFKNKLLTQIYNWFVVVLALFDIWMVYSKYIYNPQLFGTTHWSYVASASWLFFIIDYFIELKKSPSTGKFGVLTTCDLIALLPHHPTLVIFRIPRILRILRYFHFFGKVGISKKVRNKFYETFYRSGLIYLICLSLLILIIASLSYGYFEGHAFHNSVWWAINTVSGLGGFMPPKTLGGKAVAVCLMFGGVGFITLTTSVMTNIFTTTREDKTKAKNKKTIQDIQTTLRNIQEQSKQNKKKLDRIMKEINQKNK